MKQNTLKTILAVILMCVGISSAYMPAQAAERKRTAKNERLYIVRKDGVLATLYDCRFATGHDLSGKIMFDNQNSYPVTVKYQIYGITGEGKKVKVDQGELSFEAKQAPTWGWTYSYDDMRSLGWKKYKEYAVALKVEKNGAPTTTQTTSDKVYADLRQKVSQGKELTQGDYAKAIRVAEIYALTVQNGVEKMRKSYDDLTEQQQKEIDRKFAKEIGRFQWLVGLLTDAMKAGKLNSTNLQDFQKMLMSVSEG